MDDGLLVLLDAVDLGRGTGVHGGEAHGGDGGHHGLEGQRHLGVADDVLEVGGILLVEPQGDGIGVVDDDLLGGLAAEGIGQEVLEGLCGGLRLPRRLDSQRLRERSGDAGHFIGIVGFHTSVPPNVLDCLLLDLCS